MIFNEVGRVSYVPNLQTGECTNPVFGRKSVSLFSDLLLHDVGTGDDIKQVTARATRSERWPSGACDSGVRCCMTVQRPPSKGDRERHNGESAGAAYGLAAPSPYERNDLLVFLRVHLGKQLKKLFTKMCAQNVPTICVFAAFAGSGEMQNQ